MIAPLLAALLLTQAPAASPPPAAVPSETPVATPEPDAPPELTPLERLRIENNVLRVRLAAVEKTLADVVASVDRDALDAAITARVPGWRWDWQIGRLLRAAPETPPASADASDKEPQGD